MKRIIFLIIIIFLSIEAFSQYEIKGIIYSAEDSLPMPGVLVKVLKTNIATISDINGSFLLKIPDSACQIRVAMSGFEEQTIDVNVRKQDFYKIFLIKRNVEIPQVIIACHPITTEMANALNVRALTPEKLSVSPDISSYLTEVPGVDLIKRGNAVQKPVIRGLTGTNILVLKDGFRLENYQFSEDHPFLADNIGVKQIDIIKGPASLLYGSDAIGGIINFISDDEVFNKELRADYGINYFSNGNGIQTQLGIKSRVKRIKWGVRGTVNSQADFYDGTGTQVKNTRFNRQVAKAFLTYSPPNATFKLNYDFSNNQFGMCVPPALSFVTDNTHKNKYFYQSLQNHFIRSRNTFHFFNATRTDVNLSYENNKRALVINSADTPAINMDLQTFTYNVKNNIYWRSTQIITGFQGYYKINMNNHEAKEKIIPDFTRNNFAGYLLIKHSLYRVNLLYGLRYDYSLMHVLDDDFSGKSLDTALKYNNLSGSIGVAFSPKHFRIKINFANGFRTPNIPELTQNGLHGSRYEQGNMSLKTQNNYEGDFSVHYHIKRFMFDFTTFYNKINNYIYLAQTPDTVSDGLKIYRYEQANAILYGFEAGSEFKPVKNLDVKIQFAMIKDTTDNGYLPLIPQNKLKSQLAYNFGKIWKMQDLTLSLSNTYAFARSDVGMFEQPAKAYDLTDISLKFVVPFGKYETDWSLSCTNVFNTVYNDKLSTLQDAGFYDIGRSFNVSLYIPLLFDLEKK